MSYASSLIDGLFSLAGGGGGGGGSGGGGSGMMGFRRSSKGNLGGGGPGSQDDSFVDLLRQHPDLWREAFTGSNILCCPVSVSLGDDVMREQLMSHVLIPDRVPGEYTTLRGERVHMTGNELVCGMGFPEARKVRVLMVTQLSDSMWGGKTITVYRLSRPLVGGLAAPEEADEVSLAVMFKYIAVMRSFPEAESAFTGLDEFLKEVNFVGRQSTDGFARIKPSLASSLQHQWKKTTDKLVRAGALSNCMSNDSDAAKQQIGQIVESYMMHGVAGTVYPWICEHNQAADESILSVIAATQACTQTDLGIRLELQCCLTETTRELCTLSQAQTPVDKLLVMKRTIALMREAVDKNVRRNFPGTDIEMATDDLVLLLIWVIIQTFPTYKRLPADVRYANEYHFVSSSRSQLGFIMCHFQVAMTWFADRANATKALRSSSSSSSSAHPFSHDKQSNGVSRDEDIKKSASTDHTSELSISVSVAKTIESSFDDNDYEDWKVEKISEPVPPSTSTAGNASSTSNSDNSNNASSTSNSDNSNSVGNNGKNDTQHVLVAAAELPPSICTEAAVSNAEWIKNVLESTRLSNNTNCEVKDLSSLTAPSTPLSSSSSSFS